jgi:hypothetical protein
VRRVAVLAVVLFLVNLPFVHETLIERRVQRYGEDTTATVVEARRVGQGTYLDVRLPDPPPGTPADSTVPVRVDRATWDAARRSRTVPVRVVPGDPGSFRVEGQVGNRLFAVMALGADALAVLAAVVWWRRRRWRLFRVEEVGAETVALERRGTRLTATAPERWLLRTRPGQRVGGTLHLAADQDVLALGPAAGGPGLEPAAGGRTGAALVVRGRVLDVGAGVVLLEVADDLEVTVETGPHRNRADVREVATASGLLHFTPHR